MRTEELKAIRKGAGLSQLGFAQRLGISRKTYNEMENGGAIDLRTELAVQSLARTVKLIDDIFWVEESIRNTFIVVRRTVREYDRPNAIYSGHTEVMLYGEFYSYRHAQRWCRALTESKIDPRNTRKLERQRAIEVGNRKTLQHSNLR